MTTPPGAQRSLTWLTGFHTYALNTQNKFNALPSVRILQEAHAFYGDVGMRCFNTLQKHVEEAYKRQVNPLHTIQSGELNPLAGATLQELETLKGEIAKNTVILKEIQQITGAAFADCAAQKIFGDLFAIPKFLTETPPTSIQNTPTTKTSSSTQPSNKTPVFLEKIHQLSAMVKLFADDRTTNNMWTAVDALDKLGLCSVYSHLDSIHKNEHEKRLTSDLDYGKNAMMSQYPTSNLERRRAIQRTIVELALEGLESMVAGTQKTTIQETLEILEQTPMDPKDLPNNKDNPAHILFGELFILHRKAREKDCGLVDPSDSKFNSEFGRHAFWCPDAKQVDPSTKTQAVKAVREALKKAWKM
jgi:hypothetical protein